MKIRLASLNALAVLLLIFSSCNDGASGDKATGDSTVTGDSSAASSGPSITEQAVDYKADTTTAKGFVAFDASKTDKRPIVLIVHEWWGLNDYVKRRAKQLAELGYLAFAVDMYGNGAQGNDPKAATALSKPFYGNGKLIQSRIEAALAKAKTYPEADTTKVAAIGYCFGGAMVLNAARLGVPLNAVVSFHGNLAGPKPKIDPAKTQILVCHGSADTFVPEKEVAEFKKQMDAAKVKYTFKEYANAKHAFTNPDATENGKKFGIPVEYNEAADKQSWQDMMDFFAKWKMEN